MPTDKRNRPEKADNDTEQDVQNELRREEEAASKDANENPQRGESWSNYRTRELSTNEEGEGSEQTVSNQTEENPQDGGNWNNYRTREMGGEAGGENFYRNRDRGNYEEGQGEDDGGGGSLY